MQNPPLQTLAQRAEHLKAAAEAACRLAEEAAAIAEMSANQGQQVVSALHRIFPPLRQGLL